MLHKANELATCMLCSLSDLFSSCIWCIFTFSQPLWKFLPFFQIFFSFVYLIFMLFYYFILFFTLLCSHSSCLFFFTFNALQLVLSIISFSFHTLCCLFVCSVISCSQYISRKRTYITVSIIFFSFECFTFPLCPLSPYLCFSLIPLNFNQYCSLLLFSPTYFLLSLPS